MKDRFSSRPSFLLLLGIGVLAGCGREASRPDPTEGEQVPAPILARDGDAVGLGAIEARLYPPAFVMDHQARIGLDDTQRTAILDEVRATQTELVELDAELRLQLESFGATLDEPTVEEADALAQLEAVMAAERRIKTAHFRMLLRIRSQLTEAQRAELDSLRE